MTKRVLFIDDELRIWENQLREELNEFGFEVRGAENPSNALRVIASYKPDVVLLDILFGSEYLGKPTLNKIKVAYPKLPVIMITSTMDKEEYRSEDYELADYRYAKAALAEGDYGDLAFQLDRLIEKARAKEHGEADNKPGYSRFGFIVGQTKAMREVVNMIEKVAAQDITVLILGETGTGKELLARAIHAASLRRDNPFVVVNCGAIPNTLVESELFGHEKGAFTGAHSQKIGKFEAAGNGTIFLDEISEMLFDTQVKLLRFLQEKQFERVGGNKTISSTARIIAATNRDLEELVQHGRFREDLFFRLNVIAIHIPPLRERKEDIPLFFEHFVKKADELSRKRVLTILRDDLRELLTSHPWPGNIRELENMISRAIALAEENILQVENFSDLTRQDIEGTEYSSDVSDIVAKIYDRKVDWDQLKDEFGARGLMRKAVLEQIIKRWIDKYQRRPSSEELAQLLSVSGGNMRRILSESGIKLTEYSDTIRSDALWSRLSKG